MIKKNLLISEILKSSFDFIFSNIVRRVKEGFLVVLLITIAFNGLNFLITNSLATNFTIFLFIIFSMLLMSSIGISIHNEILINQKQSFLSDFLTFKNLIYLLNILTITLVAISPLLLHYMFKIFGKVNLFGFDISYLFALWMFTCILSLRLVFILPKIALDRKFKYSFSEFNSIGTRLFVLFVIITIIFFIPSVIILSFQLSLLSGNSQAYIFIKPIFDLVSFYISYLNYLVIFAAISYAYKKIENN